MTSGRIRTLDHVRGLSILGILLVNSIAFAQPFDVYVNPPLSPVPLSAADLRVWWVTDTFFRDKFITLFSLLFGVSIYLVGRDRKPSDPAYRTPLFRRLAWLVVFGLIHGIFIWHGDILLSYALTGFVFWRWQDASAGKLLLWGLGLFLVGNAVMLLPSIVSPAAGPPPQFGNIPEIVAHMRGGFFSSLSQNAAVWAQGAIGEILGYLPVTLGLMMAGLGLFKSGFFSGELRTRAYLLAILAGAGCLAVIGWQAAVTVDQGFPYPQIFGLYALANGFLCLPVALGYVGALVLAGRTRIGAKLLYPLACAGQMAFTNYLCQSLIMTGLFYGGRGATWFGEMNHAALVPIVAAIWIGQLIFSTLWMTLFRYGPSEWGWRCLTYARWMPILK